MRHKHKITDEIRKKLLHELKLEVAERFDGNKASAATTIGMHRVPFTNLCNGKEGSTIDKLIEIGTQLGWEIDLSVDRKNGDKK